MDGHKAVLPAILEIPSKDHPYDPSKDSILRRAKVLFVSYGSALKNWSFASSCSHQTLIELHIFETVSSEDI